MITVGNETVDTLSVYPIQIVIIVACSAKMWMPPIAKSLCLLVKVLRLILVISLLCLYYLITFNFVNKTCF